MSKKYIIIHILSCMIAGITIVIILAQINPITSQGKPDFRRTYDSPAILLKAIQLESATHIIGQHDSGTFIQTKIPDKIFKVDSRFEHLDTINLPVAQSAKLNSRFSFEISDSLLYLFAGNDRSLQVFTLTGKPLRKTQITANMFSRALPLSSDTVVFRGVTPSSPLKEHLFKAIQKVGHENYTIIKENAATGMAGGDLLFDSAHRSFLYVPYTNDTVSILDLNLQFRQQLKLLGRSTINSGKMVFKKLNKQKILVKSGLEQLLQLSSVLYGDKLYVRSWVYGLDEDPQHFKNYATVDVYDLNVQKYLKSFKLPRLDDEPLLKFFINGNKLIGLYPHQLALFKLPAQH